MSYVFGMKRISMKIVFFFFDKVFGLMKTNVTAVASNQKGFLVSLFQPHHQVMFALLVI